MALVKVVKCYKNVIFPLLVAQIKLSEITFLNVMGMLAKRFKNILFLLRGFL